MYLGDRQSALNFTDDGHATLVQSQSKDSHSRQHESCNTGREGRLDSLDTVYDHKCNDADDHGQRVQPGQTGYDIHELLKYILMTCHGESQKIGQLGCDDDQCCGCCKSLDGRM